MSLANNGTAEEELMPSHHIFLKDLNMGYGKDRVEKEESSGDRNIRDDGGDTAQAGISRCVWRTMLLQRSTLPDYQHEHIGINLEYTRRSTLTSGACWCRHVEQLPTEECAYSGEE